MPASKMLIDAFQVTNEIEIIKFRIAYLHEFVDKVIIAESNLTHSGTAKPLYFTEWFSAIDSRFKEKIEIIYVPLTANMTTWERERFTREYLRDHLVENFYGSRFILSDVDEIPSVEQVRKLSASTDTFHFHTPTFFRRLNWMLPDDHRNWARGVMGTISNAKLTNAGRYDKKLPRIEGAPGAHFSYLGFNSRSLLLKLESFAHHGEFNLDLWKSHIILNYSDKYIIDHLGRSRTKGFGVLEIVKNDQNIVVQAGAISMPEFFEFPLSTPIKIKRVLASIRLSAYVNRGFISKTAQNKYNLSVFLSSNRLPILLLISCEAIMSLFIPLYQKIRLNLKNKFNY